MSAEHTAQPSQVRIPFAGEPRPLFISKALAAALLGVSPGTIDRLRDDGEIEAINVRKATGHPRRSESRGGPAGGSAPPPASSA